MKYCIHCGKQLDNGAAFCPYCGYQQPQVDAESEPKATRTAEMIHSWHNLMPIKSDVGVDDHLV